MNKNAKASEEIEDLRNKEISNVKFGVSLFGYKKAQVKEYIASIEAKNKKMIDASAAQMSDIQARNKELAEKYACLEKDYDALKEEILKKNAEIDNVNDVVSDLRNVIKTDQAQSEKREKQLRDECKNVNDDNEAFRNKFDTQAAFLAKKNNEIKILQAKNAELTSRVNKISGDTDILRDENKKLRIKIEEMSSEIKDGDDSTKRILLLSHSLQDGNTDLALKNFENLIGSDDQ